MHDHHQQFYFQYCMIFLRPEKSKSKAYQPLHSPYTKSGSDNRKISNSKKAATTYVIFEDFSSKPLIQKPPDGTWNKSQGATVRLLPSDEEGKWLEIKDTMA